MYGEISEPLAADTASGVLTIDLSALVRNYRTLQQRLAPAVTAAVVKADAYGLGAAQVVPALQAAGCRDFFVAHLGEALKLRPVLAADARLFVLNGLLPGAERQCADAGIIPVLNSLDQVTNWASMARARGTELPAVLQFDTGMSRFGLSAERRAGACALSLAAARRARAVPDEPSGVGRRARRSAERRSAGQPATASPAAFPGAELCFANSGGIFLDAGYHGAMARPGIALYGGAPTAGARNALSPVVRLDVRVIQTRSVPAGARVGYGGAYVTSRETRLATIAAGYADGLPRHLSDKGAAYFGEVRLPIVGRVSMDSITLDISALPPGTLEARRSRRDDRPAPDARRHRRVQPARSPTRFSPDLVTATIAHTVEPTPRRREAEPNQRQP